MTKESLMFTLMGIAFLLMIVAIILAITIFKRRKTIKFRSENRDQNPQSRFYNDAMEMSENNQYYYEDVESKNCQVTQNNEYYDKKLSQIKEESEEEDEVEDEEIVFEIANKNEYYEEEVNIYDNVSNVMNH